ncbi:hypothetical protein BX265_5004 [Streptomyces sp. TLI_235]|nr:hypothetical protein [Streptomyces sp. TLI_235]PBC72220.1 hypothetical protein BX265_6842 [Streptomyces sp. TLI_235]PBC80167.1 hypothetical protein BX265_5004 [Streptomyces sp. TLI_235]
MTISAHTAASALLDLLDTAPSWLPQVTSWELFQEADGSHGLNGGLPDADHMTGGYEQLQRVAVLLNGAAFQDDGSHYWARFRWDGVPFGLYQFRPVTRWIVPATCATCPAPLSGAPDAKFVRLGDGPEGREAPVICVPCRDAMHRRWLTDNRPDAPTAVAG